MNEQDIETRVHELFALVMETEAPVAPLLARADEPKWNSLKHVEFLLALEDAFGIRFSDEDMMRIEDLPTVVALVGRIRAAA